MEQMKHCFSSSVSFSAISLFAPPLRSLSPPSLFLPTSLSLLFSLFYHSSLSLSQSVVFVLLNRTTHRHLTARVKPNRSELDLL